MHDKTYWRRTYIKMQEKIFIVDIGRVKHGFRVTACWELRNILNVSTLNFNTRRCTPEQWLRDPLEIPGCRRNHLGYILYWLLQVWDVTDCCSINSRLQISSEIQSKELEPGERAGNAVDPLTYCSGQTLYENSRIARRKRGGTSLCMDHKRILVWRFTSCSSSGRTFLCKSL
jgi:hypothetical protein